MEFVISLDDAVAQKLRSQLHLKYQIIFANGCRPPVNTVSGIIIVKGEIAASHD